ncbi:hypothetical protein QVD17_20074 [Tagetes erecta]|uniref:Uncharacterized protein n=1 Tax=Tagetes erecta TaxID=13708 RepID=A0AAD8KP88_TARER|nr:hypothetical protein QVD17_20074 [Tagetes erecta]
MLNENANKGHDRHLANQLPFFLGKLTAAATFIVPQNTLKSIKTFCSNHQPNPLLLVSVYFLLYKSIDFAVVY